MNIAVVNETSSVDKNKVIIDTLSKYNHKVFNIGMKEKGDSYELQYTHTGFLSALALNTKRADLIIAGCGTGQGFNISVMQYPNVYSGLILQPLDAFLFAQINNGNCISLALNQGYGWASDVNIKMIFETFFSSPLGGGYPVERKLPQANSRNVVEKISSLAHKNFADIVSSLDKDFVNFVLNYPGVKEFLDVDSLSDESIKKVLRLFYQK